MRDAGAQRSLEALPDVPDGQGGGGSARNQNLSGILRGQGLHRGPGSPRSDESGDGRESRPPLVQCQHRKNQRPRQRPESWADLPGPRYRHLRIYRHSRGRPHQPIDGGARQRESRASCPTWATSSIANPTYGPTTSPSSTKKSKARRWAPATDIPWAALGEKPVAEPLEAACAQLYTFLQECQIVSLDFPSRWVALVNQDFLEQKSCMCAQMLDASRLLEVFRKRALYGGAGLKRASVTAEQGLKEWLWADKFPQGSVSINLSLAGLLLAIYRQVSAFATTTVDRKIMGYAMQDAGAGSHTASAMLALSPRASAGPARLDARISRRERARDARDHRQSGIPRADDHHQRRRS